MAYGTAPALRTLFVDTQGLIYAFEAGDPLWLNCIDSRLAAGYRLVLTEEHLDELARSATLDAALAMTRQAVQRRPLWLRSLADLKTDEVCRFAASIRDRDAPLPPVTALVEAFVDVSQVGERHQQDPEAFLRFAALPAAREGMAALLQEHAKGLNFLTAAEASGQLSKEARERSVRESLRRLLARGSPSASPAAAAVELERTVKQCVEHLPRLLRECPVFATELHLSDYRCSNPKRKARESDSRDLTMAVAAFPNVSTFVTHVGYLHGGLQYVQKHLLRVDTELLQRPPTPSD